MIRNICKTMKSKKQCACSTLKQNKKTIYYSLFWYNMVLNFKIALLNNILNNVTYHVSLKFSHMQQRHF